MIESRYPLKPCKVTLIGETAVGKTSIISRFYKNSFDPNCISSLGASFVSKIIDFPEYNTSLRYDIWDTAGQEKYRSLAKIFYKDTQILIFVYDCTKKSTFDAIKNYWYPQVTEMSKNLPLFALAANKSDLYMNEEVEETAAIEYATAIGAIFKKTSALNNAGIDDLFDVCAKKFLNPSYNYLEEEKKLKEEYQREQEEKVDLNNPNEEKTKNSCC